MTAEIIIAPMMNARRIDPPPRWHDMDSAPMDGKPVMLFARAKNATAPVIVIGWHLEEYGWIEAAFSPNKPVGVIPQFWRELPAFPTISARISILEKGTE